MPGRDPIIIRMGSIVPGMTEAGTDWRPVDGVLTAWFDAASLSEGAALAGRIVELSGEIVADVRAVRRFWQRVLDYAPAADGGLADPLRRDPAVRIRQSTEPRPLRNRIHLDVVRPAAAVEQAVLGEGSGPYGVCHTDPDGNEVDLVPGAALGAGAGTADWQAVFSAMRATASPRRRSSVTWPPRQRRWPATRVSPC